MAINQNKDELSQHCIKIPCYTRAMKTYQAIYLELLTHDGWISGEQLAQKLDLSRTSIWKGIQRLEQEGLLIEKQKKKGYRLSAGDLLLPDQISRELNCPTTLNTESQSTQYDAKTIAPEDEKHLYLANQQQAAKGRFGRSFYAEKNGGIYMSYRFRTSSTLPDLPHYTLMIAASIVLAIEKLTDKKPQIKWVNDIYLEGKKIAGILTESQLDMETGLVAQLIIGVGLNFKLTAIPDSLSSKITSLFSKTPNITRQDLIIAIWKTFLTTPTETLLATYQSHCFILGKHITFSQNGQNFSGIAQDIDEKGQLIVALENGHPMILNSGEISLNTWE